MCRPTASVGVSFFPAAVAAFEHVRHHQGDLLADLRRVQIHLQLRHLLLQALQFHLRRRRHVRLSATRPGFQQVRRPAKELAPQGVEPRATDAQPIAGLLDRDRAGQRLQQHFQPTPGRRGSFHAPDQFCAFHRSSAFGHDMSSVTV